MYFNKENKKDNMSLLNQSLTDLGNTMNVSDLMKKVYNSSKKKIEIGKQR